MDTQALHTQDTRDRADDVVICPQCGAHLQRVFPRQNGSWGCICPQCTELFRVYDDQYFDRAYPAPIHIDPDPEVQRG